MMDESTIIFWCSCPHGSAGVSIPRQANDGTFLPSARDISLAVHKDVDNPHLHLTAMAAIWGQLVHNDISHTPQMAGEFSLPSSVNHVILKSHPFFFPLPFVLIYFFRCVTNVVPSCWGEINFLFRGLSSINLRLSDPLFY